MNEAKNKSKVNFEVLSMKMMPKDLQYCYEKNQKWYDGYFTHLFRKLNKPGNDSLSVLMCDGAIDAIWVENLNSLLDDNKCLCLANNEIISMNSNLRIFFEVHDLAVASPATVSRCGIINFDNGFILPQDAYNMWKR